MPFSQWVTVCDLEKAVATIVEEIRKMSGTLEQQLQTLTANISSDAAAIKSDLDAILAKIQPGSTISQADIDALTAVSNAMDALKTAADAGAGA